MSKLDELREIFKDDQFAAQTLGAEIVSAEPDASVCKLVLRPCHYNRNGTVHGGAIFTLGDFAFAVAAKAFTEKGCISLQHDISYTAATKGSVLYAKASCLKQGRTVCMFSVDITDDLGVRIAYMTVNGFCLK